MKSTKTPLMRLVKLAFSLAEIEQNSTNKVEVDQSRRKFMSTIGFGAIAANSLSSCNRPEVFPGKADGKQADLNQSVASIAIVGGGIAGLHAAHILAKHNISNFKIYEGSNRAGGRIYTAKNIMANGLTTELGGEFIDSGHKDMLKLVNEFGFQLYDAEASSEASLVKDAYFFNGRHYSLQEIVDAFCAITPRLRQDINSLPDSIDYKTTDPVVIDLDNLSISAYLQSIGASGVIKDLLEVAYETEYGLSPHEQSSINLLFLISPNTKKCTQWSVFGDSDERYKVKGGNQKIVDRLASMYENYIETNKLLTRIKKTPNGKYQLFFGSHVEHADIVLITIPFTTLRNVNIELDLSVVKRKSINELGYGTNAKLMLGFDQRIWRNQGFSGSVFTDNGLQLAWDNSQQQPGTSGGITVYSGGQTGIAVGQGGVQSKVTQILPKLNEIYPGIASKYNGNSERMHWPSHPFTLGSYACYKPGQWTSIGGAEIEEADGVYFAGEHCSADFQGYMNGGAETGRVAAKKIIQFIRSSNN